MNILSKLTVKPLLWVAGVELAIIGLLVAGLFLQDFWFSSKLTESRGAADTAAAAATTARAERDTWKGRTAELEAANSAFAATTATLQRLLAEAQKEARRMGEEGRRAVDAAQARADEADRTLSSWMKRYADQVRVGDCAAALNAVQAACPALEGY